jgi:hypothetical protein
MRSVSPPSTLKHRQIVLRAGRFGSAVLETTHSQVRPHPAIPHCYDRLESASKMACHEVYKSPPTSPQKHLEEARRLLLERHIRRNHSTRHQLLLEPAKRIWPEGASFLRKEIAPRQYKGKIETIYSANKHKQKLLQLHYSPTKKLQAHLKAKCRRAEIKATADAAAAKRRLRRALLGWRRKRKKKQNRETPASEKDLMAELGCGMDIHKG